MNAADRPTEVLVVAHHHPGRLRVRSLVLRDPGPRATAIAAVSGAPGVERVSAGATTGSVLVEYDPARVDAGALAERMARATGLSVATRPPRRGDPAATVFAAARTLDQRVAAWTDGRFDLRLALPVALGVGSVASFVWSRHDRAPRWDNLLYWGITFFRALHPEGASGAQARARDAGL